VSQQDKSLADDIIGGLRSVTKAWTRQRKAEERQAAQRLHRYERLVRRHRETIKDVACEIMEKAYLAASANGTLPANARQVMYAARPEIQERTGRQLDDQYFCQTLLPDYIEEHEVDWDVVFDDRGHFREPHTQNEIGLGTLSVRGYLSDVGDIDFQEPELQSGVVLTHGPAGCFGAVLFVEKEGFMPLLEAVNLAERFDLAIMSTKGLSVTAARKLIDEVCGGHKIPLLVLHDFDKSGFSIIGTLQRDTRRYSFANDVEVIDLGLRLTDVNKLKLPAERAFDKGDAATRRANLRENGATGAEIEFLLHERVELNALPSDRLVAFIEDKLKRHGVKKLIPDREDLAAAYECVARGFKVEEIIAKALKVGRDGKILAPRDIEDQVRRRLTRNPKLRWTHALASIAREQRRDASPARRSPTDDKTEDGAP
jgi:Topoisomerase 6 subunit A/Spo11, Toprim domain